MFPISIFNMSLILRLEHYGLIIYLGQNSAQIDEILLKLSKFIKVRKEKNENI